ncbi:serine/threonine-protein kinase [Streptomyces sp. 35G-GA-8]|uniref:serine/threonine-protein kinase n=1 Tax=Streptomyces sp. 35G-GA-8 TaxID=2939434 RepID=UPI00201F7B11|nr:serine/threonine-protein kinase [Streptomyces sp. 35G-GA-8]MCL7377868.1 serine/threonine protein kinase [Streptomyces sp. 35G-GA-8]
MNAGGPERRVIDGRFELLDRLGSGGMGMVWRARDLALHREVALKEVRPPDPAMLAADPAAARTLRERVLREARALARIDHPNVVTIHHIVDAAEVAHPWIVMELVPGASLQDRLAHGPLSPGETARIGRGVLAALRAAHAAGIHHRDVKPANVLLRADGRPVLTDFGIAALRESSGLTATGELIGSPDYIAPERIRGDEGDPASDLWSLGMLMYVAVEGRHPLRRATTLATLAAVLDEEIPPPVRAGRLAPVLVALLTRDTGARPDAAGLDRMLAAVPQEPPRPEGTGRPERDGPRGGLAVGPVDTVTLVDRSPTPPSPPVPPSPYAYVPPAPLPAGRGRLGRGVSVAATVVAVSLAGVLIWTLVPWPGDSRTDGDSAGGDRSVTGAPAPSAPLRTPTGSVSPSASPSTSPEGSPDSLLSPSAIRNVIAGLKPVMGGTDVNRFVVYDDYASAEAPVPDDKRLYDTFQYRDGEATRQGAGGTLIAGKRTVDLTSFDWDALPGLLRTAEKDLGVDKPTNRYVIVDPAWVFADDQPVLLVYVMDDYGAAYLAASRSGKVLDTVPREGG